MTRKSPKVISLAFVLKLVTVHINIQQSQFKIKQVIDIVN
jgi:hypothetical protein